MLLPETCDPNTAPSFDNGATVLATATNGHVITLACADTFETNDADVTARVTQLETTTRLLVLLALDQHVYQVNTNPLLYAVFC